MKKTISVIMAAAMLTSSAVAFSSFADDAEGTGGEEQTYSDYVLNCEGSTPEIDGVIDEAYYQSFRIKHEFNRAYSAEESGEHRVWPSGRYEARDPIEGSDDTKLNYAKTAELVAQYFNNDPAEATSYFLWEDGHLYVAVEVKDKSISDITDDKYKMALDVGINDAGLYLIDGVMPKFTWPVQNITFSAFVDAGARCGYVNENPWVLWNKWSRDEKGDAKYNGHLANEEDGLWAVKLTDDGYVVEMDFPLPEIIASNLLRDYGEEDGDSVGLFQYGMCLIDVPEDFNYAEDQGKLQDGIHEEGFQSGDFMVLNDFGDYNSASTDVKFSTQKVKASEPEIIVGDVNNDGSVDTADLVRLMKYIAADGEGIEAINTDINGDGETNSADLIRLMKIIAAGDETEPETTADTEPETTEPAPETAGADA